MERIATLRLMYLMLNLYVPNTVFIFNLFAEAPFRVTAILVDLCFLSGRKCVGVGCHSGK